MPSFGIQNYVTIERKVNTCHSQFAFDEHHNAAAEPQRDDPGALSSGLGQRPEPIFSAILSLQPGKIGVLCFEFAETLDRPGKLGRRGQMLGRIAVVLQPRLDQCEIVHRAQGQRGRQRLTLR